MMSRGYLYYAHNNGIINYLKIAICSALTGKHFLNNFNATIITDKHSYDSLEKEDVKLFEKCFDNVVFQNSFYENNDNQRPVIAGYSNLGKHAWWNKSRPNAFNDTPYDETILVDVDYIFQDNNTDKLWGSKVPLKMNKDMIPLGVNRLKDQYISIEDQRVSTFTIPMYWATLVYFRKDQFTNDFFNLVNHIKDNYLAYCYVYNINNTMYRNDFAFSIALYMMNGSIRPSQEYELPFKYVLATSEARIHQLGEHTTRFLFPAKGEKEPWQYLNLQDISYHCMNKISLQEHYNTFLHFYGK